MAQRGSVLPTGYVRAQGAPQPANHMDELSTDEVARAFGVPLRTAQLWVRGWAETQHDPTAPRVRKAATDSRKWRYLVDRASLHACFPLLSLAQAA